MRRGRLVGLMLTLYLAPTLALGRVWAAVGTSPLYLPDLLAMFAAVGAAPALLRQLHQSAALRRYALAVAVLAVLVAQGVYRGDQAAYPDALKYATMAVYPVVSVAIAGWLREHPDAMRHAPKMLVLVPVGLAFVLATGRVVISSAYGLYIACVVAFAWAPAVPRRVRRWLALAGGVAFLPVTAEFAKRGVLITVVVAGVAAAFAAGRARTRRASAGLVIAVSFIGALVGMVALFVPPTRWPYIGAAFQRLAQTFTDSGTAASNNVGIRQAFWSYALHQANLHPLAGAGAGHYLEVIYGSNDVSTDNIGAHNSFIGYAFYFGYPAALIVAGLFAWALVRAWRARAVDGYAPALFGCVVAAVVTALTNVALESPYIAGPSWLAVGAVVALSQSDRVPVGHVVAADVGQRRSGGRASGRVSKAAIR